MIPLHILTGFLGSGKTTLLARLLQNPGGERIAVLVNEAGDLPLDHLLLERVDEDVLALASGCACCTMRGELYEAIGRVLALQPTRIVLETTGLADPAPILSGLATDPRLSAAIEVASVIAVVDAPRFETLLDEHPEVRRQLEFADRVVLAKADLAPQRVPGALEQLAREAPGREVLAAVDGQVEPGWLFAAAPLGLVRRQSDAHAWLHHGSEAATFQTCAVSAAAPARVDAVHLWMQLVTLLDGPRLLRIKALVECADTGELYVVQSAGRAVFPPRRLAHRPAGVHGAQVVIIARGLADEVLDRLQSSLRSALAGDRFSGGADAGSAG